MGAKRKKDILQNFKTIEELYNANEEQLLKINGIGKKYASIISNSALKQEVDKHVQYMIKHNVDIISIRDDEYPQILKNISKKLFN